MERKVNGKDVYGQGNEDGREVQGGHRPRQEDGLQGRLQGRHQG